MTAAYGYRALDHLGEIQKGTLMGDGPESVAERVRRMGLRPITVERKRAQFLQRELSIPGFGGKRTDALALFSRQFATMIGAGTPILNCLSVLERQIEDKAFAAAVGLVRADVENGDQLSDAVARQPDWFSEFYVAMVRSGESAGSLPTVLERLAVATESAARLRKKVRSALAYPTVVAGLIGLTVLAMLLFLIPTFAGIFKDLKGTLPLPTRVLVGASNVLTSYFPIVFLSTVGSIWGFRRWKRTDAGRLRWDRVKLRLPVFGKLVSQTALARFSRSLAVLATTGVPVVDALEIAKGTAANKVVENAVSDVARAVNSGSRLAAAMAEHDVFTEMVVQMVEVGEESGAVDAMLVKVAELYEQDVDATVDGLTSLLEPLLIVAMGVTVGGMLLAVYLPMFKAVSLVK